MEKMQFLDISLPELVELGEQKHQEYAEAHPFPSIYIDNFFNAEALRQVLAEFPELGKEGKGEVFYANPNEAKYASKGEYKFGPLTREFMHFLNSQPFLEFLQNLTGIKETLIPDPYFEGGGCHQIKPGGFLKVHVDFHKHKMMGLDRRVNVLVYLNEDWKEEYGGHFELWERDMSQCAVRIAPLFNRMAIFSTTDYSWHGHPDALACPPDRSRKSLALYYYTNGRPASEVSEANRQRITTTFAARKGQDSARMTAFNSMVNLANDLLPPIVVKAIKRFRRQ
jgi:Rps23 Pro-64 3,4-dihydroxylase Tpa1-like proline 4-hydroxylase